MCLHTCTHECTHTLTHTHRPSSIGALLPKAMRHDKLAVGHGYIFHMHAHTTHTHMHMCSHTHTCKHIHSHESHACMHTYTCMCAHTHIHTHKHHTHIHTKTTHIHTQNTHTHTQLYGVPVTRGHEAWQTDCELWWCLAQASRQTISKLADYTEQADSDTKQEIAELRAEVEREKAHAKYVEDKYRRLKVRPHPLCCSSAHWLLVLRHLVLRGLDVLMNGNGGEGGGERRERVCVYVCECMCEVFVCGCVCVRSEEREGGKRGRETSRERETSSVWKEWGFVEREKENRECLERLKVR